LDGKAASSHTHTIANITDFKTGTWTNISRLEWTNNFGWENVGPFMLPTEASNFDIVVSNSITPTTDYMYNLGQKQRRYTHVFTEFVMCGSVCFNKQTNEMFTGSYNELRDLPTWIQPTQIYMPLHGFDITTWDLNTPKSRRPYRCKGSSHERLCGHENSRGQFFTEL
jgi:hypothetical protein